jgi:DNA-binding response OmpR family regulator
MNIPKIIVIDDDLATCQLIETALQLEGYRTVSVTQIADGNIAALLNRHQPDALILDFHLQTEETLKYVALIRANETWQMLPVLIMSGINRRRQCEEAGADGFILKPFNWQELTAEIRKIIEKND